MRKIFFYNLVLILLLSGQNAQSQDAEFVIPKNAEVKVQGKAGIDVTATDIYSRNSKLKRKIELYDTKNNIKIGEVFISLESSNKKENMYDKIKNNPGSFSGVLTVEIGGQVIYSRQIINGVAAKGTIASYAKVPGPKHNPSVACNVSTVHNCVAWEIDDMNWIEYGACLVGAPACYATLWASCSWEVCHNHIQYTNPN